jgi:hypothetical protein
MFRLFDISTYYRANTAVEWLYSDEQGWVDYLTQVLWWIVHVHLVLVTLWSTCIVHCLSLPMYTTSTVTLHPKRTWKWTDCSSSSKPLHKRNGQTVHPPCICDILSKAYFTSSLFLTFCPCNWSQPRTFISSNVTFWPIHSCVVESLYSWDFCSKSDFQTKKDKPTHILMFIQVWWLCLWKSTWKC